MAHHCTRHQRARAGGRKSEREGGRENLPTLCFSHMHTEAHVRLATCDVFVCVERERRGSSLLFNSNKLTTDQR